MERQIVIAEKQRTDVPDIVGCRSCERGKSLPSVSKVADHKENLNEEDKRDGDAARCGQPIDLALFFDAEARIETSTPGDRYRVEIEMPYRVAPRTPREAVA